MAIAAGSYTSYALKTDGTVWAWGANNGGQIGDGTTTTRTSPVAVSGLSNVIAIAAGATHALALKGDGTVWAWGSNAYGQLGDGTTTSRTTPVQVTSLSTSTLAISAHANISHAVKTDRTLWSWGDNYGGALGDGTTTSRSTPVATTGLTDMTAAGGSGTRPTPSPCQARPDPGDMAGPASSVMARGRLSRPRPARSPG